MATLALEGYVHFIFRKTNLSHNIFTCESMTFSFTWGSEDNFFIYDVIQVCLWETLHNSFLFNFYMIFIYFILKKRKRTFLKKINILATLHSENHDYPVFVGVPVLRVMPHHSYGNPQRTFWFRYQAFIQALLSKVIFPQRFSFFSVCLAQWLRGVTPW